ncbi:uncharacterized protein J8A68_000878 [[Candida] subhashii]|uniref:Uncharacterized protein n=1 Tax=[Candida] subhashii TaxID=561895 RepID=A0A8J5UTT0_9ASCO|nr:uncharacterized protein J8A68_000878 [[Candida] subhashii]KAG7665672.1 hypothetical protein J8A68_000878 [[Candida] subhashii]
MKLSNITYASIIAGAAAEEFFPFKAFLKGDRLSKRSCLDCYSASEIQVEHCPEDLLYDVDKKIELFECLCALPIEYYQKMVDCMYGCDELSLSETTTFDADGLKSSYCVNAKEIQTYNGDLEDFPNSMQGENNTSVLDPMANVISSTATGSTTSSTNSAATLGVASILALFALSLL